MNKLLVNILSFISYVIVYLILILNMFFCMCLYSKIGILLTLLYAIISVFIIGMIFIRIMLKLDDMMSNIIVKEIIDKFITRIKEGNEDYE